MKRRYKRLVRKRSLPIDRARHSRKGQPMCMEQYYRLFTSYRYPGKTKDTLVTTSDNDPFDPEHIIVFKKYKYLLVHENCKTLEKLLKSVYQTHK
ncbi:hypothetical protein X801_10209 [Opisthorchis viverrini]|uniref:Choline/carnitine acyltransferase domain-containing protein n=1 Tax=Opisthorchis viverrini TaxID=6198 RepID=A0A1S8WHV3_OPIVI|nr:hypothetical protein X801_10209 [Opisthorchis viverrini]